MAKHAHSSKQKAGNNASGQVRLQSPVPQQQQQQQPGLDGAAEGAHQTSSNNSTASAAQQPDTGASSVPLTLAALQIGADKQVRFNSHKNVPVFATQSPPEQSLATLFCMRMRQLVHVAAG